MYQVVTLAELKDFAGITGSSQDEHLERLRLGITSFVERVTRKKLITREIIDEKHDAELYQGSLFLNEYPVYKISSLYDDPDREFNSDDLIATTDYVFKAKTGELTLIKSRGYFDVGIQVVKVSYWAGYSRFKVTSWNNYLDVTDSGGTVAIAITTGEYNAEDLASTIQTALNDDATLNGTYTVTYSHITQKFRVQCDEDTTVPWTTGTNATKSIGTLLGYTADDAAGQDHIADNAKTGIPDDIRYCAQMIGKTLYEMSGQDEGRQDILKKHISGDSGGTLEFIKKLPYQAEMILQSITRQIG